MSSILRQDSQTGAGVLAKVFVLALQCGLVSMGSYFAQPQVLPIAKGLHVDPSIAGLVVTCSQCGYVAGLLLVAPLGDLVENRRLVLTILGLSAASLATAAVAPNALTFFVACFGIGAFSVAVQLIVTCAASMSSPSGRGTVVGGLTGGLLMGILLAWPVASLIGNAWGWRALYGIHAGLVAASTVAMALILPSRRPKPASNYGELLKSLGSLFVTMVELRRRALMQAFLFGAFSLFWTAVPVELSGHYHLSAHAFAAFGLIGGAGALVAPVAGLAADRGLGKTVTVGGVVATLVAFLGTALADSAWMLCVCAMLINAGVQANLVTSQRRILSIDPRAGFRLNSIFVACFFLGGAAGSACATGLTHSGWEAISFAGIALAILALATTLRGFNRPSTVG